MADVEEIIQGLIRDNVWRKLDFVSLCWLNAGAVRVGENGYEISEEKHG